MQTDINQKRSNGTCGKLQLSIRYTVVGHGSVIPGWLFICPGWLPFALCLLTLPPNGLNPLPPVTLFAVPVVLVVSILISRRRVIINTQAVLTVKGKKT